MERWFTKDFRERSRRNPMDGRHVPRHQAEGYIAAAKPCATGPSGDHQVDQARPDIAQADAGTTVEMAEFIRKNIPGASMTLFDAAHIANVEQQHDYTDAVIGFLTQK